MLATIVLIQGQIPEIFNSLINEKNLTIIDKQKLYESANGAPFNDSKFKGTICQEMLNGKNVVIPNAEEYVTKKGDLIFENTFTSRITGSKKENYNFVLVGEFDQNNKLFNSIKKQADKSGNARIMSFDEFIKSDISANNFASFDRSKVRVTCGLLTKHTFNDTEIMGHSTRDFNITLDDASQLEKNDSHLIRKIFNGEIVGLDVNSKPGGSIVRISELGETAHVTVNTTIKAALSRQVLEKYNSNTLTFNLQEIDTTSKQNPVINIQKLCNTTVEITGWYCYVIDQY